jgi:aryl-alcohol dehydrogenase-like predicted oxidoreductase
VTDLLQPAAMADGRTASRLGLGTAKLGAFWQRRSPRDGARALAAALDAGITLVDTADVYARGISERLVGRAVAGRDAVVMTKVGLVKTPLGVLTSVRGGRGDTSPGDRLRGLRRGDGASRCFTDHYVTVSAHRCLRRQRREALDVLLLHEPSAADLRRAEFLPAVERLVARGSVRSWGASVRDAEAALAALDLPGLSWLQVPVNVADTGVLERVRQHPRAGRVTLVGLAVLGDGALLARARAACPDRTAAEVAAALAVGAAELPAVDAVLLGMSTEQHVRENVTALGGGVPGDLVEQVRSAVGSGRAA